MTTAARPTWAPAKGGNEARIFRSSQKYATGDLAARTTLKPRTSSSDIKSLRVITGVKTPYLPNGRFDLEAYDSLINMQIDGGAEGVIVGGTAGEGHLMSWDEHIMLIGYTVNSFGTKIKVIGNTGSNSTREAVHATEQGFVRRVGLDGP